MFVKTDKSAYLNLDNGQTLTVAEARHGREFRVAAKAVDGSSLLYVLQGGYRSQEEAQNALDAMMSELDVIELAAPKPPEETDTEDDTEEVEAS